MVELIPSGILIPVGTPECAFCHRVGSKGALRCEWLGAYAHCNCCKNAHAQMGRRPPCEIEASTSEISPSKEARIKALSGKRLRVGELTEEG